MGRLHKKGYVTDPASKAMSVVFTEEGLRESRRLFEVLVGKGAQSDFAEKPRTSWEPNYTLVGSAGDQSSGAVDGRGMSSKVRAVSCSRRHAPGTASHAPSRASRDRQRISRCTGADADNGRSDRQEAFASGRGDTPKSGGSPRRIDITTIKIVRITYDRAKRDRTLKERGLDFRRAGEKIATEHLTWPDERRDYGGERFITAGRLDDRIVIFVWTPRG